MRKATPGWAIFWMSRPQLIRSSPTSSRRRFIAHGLLMASVFTGSMQIIILLPAVALQMFLRAPTDLCHAVLLQFRGCAVLRLGYMLPEWVRIIRHPHASA